MKFGVLGSVWAEDERGRLPLKGPRHRAVLARLLVARGRVVPTAQLIDDLWERPPAEAVGAIQTFVAALRRVLEPERKPREPARVLVTVPPGYALRVAAEQVDAGRFESAVSHVDQLLATGAAGAALQEIDDALALWEGPAYAEFAEEGWARAEIGRLDELRALAVEQRARALLDLGQPAAAVAGLEAHLAGHPLREQAWQLLTLALYRSGRQSDALAALRRIRNNLHTELGLDPSPGLQALEAEILAQAPHLLPAPTQPKLESPIPPDTAPRSQPKPQRRLLVGRAEELATLLTTAELCARHRNSKLILISGVEGVGKTALAESFSATLADRGWLTAWGPSPPDPAAPSNWPWTQIRTQLSAADQPLVVGNSSAVGDSSLPGYVLGHPGMAGRPGDGADPAVARFVAQRVAVDHLAAIARDRPVFLVFEDLHQAAQETLELVAALAERLDAPVVIVGTYRSTDVGAGLTAALGRLARVEPVRIYLTGLDEAGTAELVRGLVGERFDSVAARRIHRRSNGNPFFVRELTRLLGDEGIDGMAAVPAGVRDVVRHRLAGLVPAERAVLSRAAVLGGDVDREVLAELVGDPALTLDAVETGIHSGFLVESGTGGLSFAHNIVRDVLYHDIAGPRRGAWHAEAGAVLERIGNTDPAQLAYHFTRAESRATAPRAAHYARLAAQNAEKVFAPHEAARLWRDVLSAYVRSADTDVRAHLDATMGLVRALAVTGNLADARALRAEAISTAETLADPALTARVITAFDVPAVWTDNDDPDLAALVVAATERTLAALPADERETRSRLLTTLALELRATGGTRGRDAAAEAETIAREEDNPALLAFALNGRFMQSFHRAGLAPERGRIAAELIDLAAAHNLVTFEVLGHLIGIQAHCATGDFAAADAHAQHAERLADRYDLPLVAVFIHWYKALGQGISGTYEDAEAAYRIAAASLRGAAMPGLEHGILPLALLCLRLQHGRPITDGATDFGPHEPFVRPLLLLAEDRVDDARRALRAAPDSPPDLLLELRLCLLANAALTLGDRPIIQHLYDELRPAAAELAGAGTGLLTLEPVAHYLARLATALGDQTAASEYRHRSARLAEHLRAAHWLPAGHAGGN